MPPAAHVDLSAPFERDTILEVRSSKMKTMPGLKVQTGIDKTLRVGRLPVSKMGIDEDWHDLTFHGGKDKAIHGYCSSHYPKWRDEYPAAASRFQPGGFGENFVTERMNERNVCIGDVVEVGDDGLLLQVSLPRQPCFKLNHRFQLKNFAPQTYKSSRTGWYYRVLREGTVSAGDEIRLVERKWPRWTIERVQEYLHRSTEDAAMNEELAGVADMGDESRKNFEGRVARYQARQRKLSGQGGENVEIWRDYKVVAKETETDRVSSFVLEPATPNPDVEGADLGSHARIKLPNGLVRTYSIVAGNANKFHLGIALENPSRGGSAYWHKSVREGDVLQVGRITTDVKPAAAASNHVFIVGGIGITAFLTMMEMYRQINWETTVHYGVRSESDVPFRERVMGGLGESLRLYDAAKGRRMDVPAIFKGLSWNSHVYVCGPKYMMEEATREAKAAGLGEDEVHFEAFAADNSGDPFEVEVLKREKKSEDAKDTEEHGEEKIPIEKKKTLRVGEDETLLEVLRRHFDDVPSSCEVGNCGTCKVALRSGTVDHRGTALLNDEKEGAMLSCVSRGVGKIGIEI